MFIQDERSPSERQIIELTSFMMHKHYCENDVEPIIALMDREIVWIGAGEQEYATGLEKVGGIFRQFSGQVTKCIISDEQYHVLKLAPGTFLCSGRMWIATDSSTQISLKVHQRITTIFCWKDGDFRCCHIHISNPYDEMTEEDIGFPVKMAQQSYQYLQEQVAIQKKQIAAKTQTLERLSFTDALTGLYNRNKLNEIISFKIDIQSDHLGVACCDLNGLKTVNDEQGHSAGDQLIYRAADYLRRMFCERVYRTGGDEFIIVDNLEKEDFESAVGGLQKEMGENEISCSVGFSWRKGNCSIKEQFDEADYMMYQEKRRFYSQRQNDRRNIHHPRNYFCNKSDT